MGNENTHRKHVANTRNPHRNVTPLKSHRSKFKAMYFAHFLIVIVNHWRHLCEFKVYLLLHPLVITLGPADSKLLFFQSFIGLLNRQPCPKLTLLAEPTCLCMISWAGSWVFTHLSFNSFTSYKVSEHTPPLCKPVIDSRPFLTCLVSFLMRTCLESSIIHSPSCPTSTFSLFFFAVETTY